MFRPETWWEISYAPSSRASCKKCRFGIDSGDVRLSLITEDNDHWGSNWGNYHLRCGLDAARYLKFIPNINKISDIQNIDQFEDENIVDVITSHIQRVKESREKWIKSRQAKGLKRKAENAGVASPSHPALKKNCGSPASTSSSTATTTTSPSTTTTATPTSMRTTSRLTATKESLEQKYNTMKVPELKAILKLNSQRLTGRKSELVERCCDGELNGAVQKCPQCTEGNLKLLSNGNYSCAGYYHPDGFVKCGYQGPCVRADWLLPTIQEESTKVE